MPVNVYVCCEEKGLDVFYHRGAGNRKPKLNTDVGLGRFSDKHKINGLVCLEGTMNILPKEGLAKISDVKLLDEPYIPTEYPKTPFLLVGFGKKAENGKAKIKDETYEILCTPAETLSAYRNGVIVLQRNAKWFEPFLKSPLI